ncbi:MAG: hypothetical protein WCT44_02890 [Candidatus Paceibacterota bacterium]
MDLKNIHNSKTVRGILIGLGVAIIILGVFKLGQVSGLHKARFSERFGDNFNRNFIDPREGGFFKDFSDRRGPPGGNGAVGEIVSIKLPLIVVAGPDNLEKTILIKEDTLVRRFQDEVKVADLKIGDNIVVLGVPNDVGQIEAKLIRAVPFPPEAMPNNIPIQ